MSRQGTDHEIHGSAVAIGAHGLLITGAPGSGKTTLTMELIALGAELIADDRVRLRPGAAGKIQLSAPPNISGLLEMRGFGLLRLTPRSSAPLRLIADLDQAETERLPPVRQRVLTGPDASGIACPVILCKGRPGLAAALTCLMRAEEWPGPEFLPGTGSDG